MAPKVQTLADVMAELNPAYAAQESVIGQKQAGLGAKYDAQRTGITAAKGQGFNAINNQATGRGMSFSGIPIDEQATYLSTKYLPGMQQADFQQNEEGMEYEGQLAQIGTQKYNQAFSSVEKQKSDLNAWNMQQESIAAQAREAQLNREAQAREAAANRNFQAAQASSARAASAPKQLSPYESAMSIIGAAAAKGSVSSNAFQLARDAYKQAGGNTQNFATEFWKYVPASQTTGDKWKAYYYG